MELFPKSLVSRAGTQRIEDIRARFDAILGVLRPATQMPQQAKEVAGWRVVGPQVSRWLPREDRDMMAQAVLEGIPRLEEAAQRLDFLNTKTRHKPW